MKGWHSWDWSDIAQLGIVACFGSLPSVAWQNTNTLTMRIACGLIPL